MPNVNSFTESVDQLVKQVNIALDSMVKLNESITTNEDTVTMQASQIDPITGDVSTVTYSIPSYHNIIDKVNAMTNTVDVFVKGEGVILLNDGTYRQVTTQAVPVSPAKITNIYAPTRFKPRNNWFFESLMFPQLIVSFDLKGKVDDRSDRAVVKRIVFDNYDDEQTQWFKDNVIGKDISYYDMITYLDTEDKKYWEDDEIQELPLATEPYTGYFIITDKRTISGKEWFYLDTMNYGVTSDSPVIKNIQLAVGDQLRYNNSIWKIDDINITEQRVHVVPNVGMDHPTINNSFEIYTIPFSTKILNVPIGYNECNILFIKGVNEDFNIIGDEWSNSITFYTNDLLLSGGSSNLETYYNNFVSDFGKQMEGQAKEKFVPAYFGITPDFPVFSAENFSVKQINTQLNAALDTTAVIQTQQQIESTKTIINSLKSTIAQQKATLVGLTDPGERASLNNIISDNINTLSQRTIEYQSYVQSLATLAYENSAALVEPKYRIRGFFPIPVGKQSSPNSPVQEVVQFDIAYRYLRLDGTANPLNTYTHIDTSTGQTITGVFSDWIIVTSPMKTRSWDSTLERYIWDEENISDGEIVNINQIDIPIQKGEKVELKIRSISEAGQPTNPLKSDWSPSVIVEFPANLQGSNQVATILTGAAAEETTIKLEETLAATGVTTHMDDSVPNPNSGSGTYFKHQAPFIEVTQQTKNAQNTLVSENTTDLQSFVNNLPSNLYVAVNNTYNRGTYGAGTYAFTLERIINELIRCTSSNFSLFNV